MRRDRRRRARPRHASRWRTGAASGAPSRSAPASCSRAGPVILRRADPQGPAGADPYGVRVGRRARRQGAGRPGQPDLRRGPPRRRAGREGLGRRPADRGRGRGVPRGRRRPRPSTCATSGPGPSAGSACSSTTWCPAPRRAGSPTSVAKSPVGQARADRRPPVRRHLGGGEARAARHEGVAGRPAQRRVEAGRLPAASAGRTATRPTSPAPGSTSSAASRRSHDLEPALLGRVEELIDFVTAALTDPFGRQSRSGSLTDHHGIGRRASDVEGTPPPKETPDRGPEPEPLPGQEGAAPAACLRATPTPHRSGRTAERDRNWASRLRTGARSSRPGSRWASSPRCSSC